MRSLLLLLPGLVLAGCNDDDNSDGLTPIGAPSAAIQGAATVSGLTFVQLDGSASSDPQAGPLNYAWTQVGGTQVVLNSTDTPATSFLAPNDDVLLVFRLTVEDDEGLTDTSEIAIDVTTTLPTVDLPRLSGFAVAGGGEGQAEIVSYHPGTQRLFAVSGGQSRLDAFDLSDPSNPVEVGAVLFDGSDALAPAGEPNSVATSDQFVAVALAAPNKQDNGFIVLLDPETLAVLDVAEAGALPDMLAFSPDGTRLMACNEGEPNDDYTDNPPGSLTLLWIDDQGVDATWQVSFASTDVLKDAAIANGFRFTEDPDVSLSQDLEPEFLAFSADSDFAYVGCQENNCVLVYDVKGRSLLGAFPLGTKDWQSPVQPRWFELQLIDLGLLPEAGVAANGEVLRLGGLAGLHFEGEDPDGRLQVVAIPAGGPQIQAPVGKFLRQALPDYQSRVLRMAIDTSTGAVEVLEEVLLVQSDGETPISDRPNLQATAPGLANYDQTQVDLDNQPLDLDPLGLLAGGLVVAPNGDFWVADERRPSVARFSPEGVLVERFVPEGSNAFGVNVGTEALPSVYAQRIEGRGFTAMALDESTGYLHLWNESPLDNPDTPNNLGAQSSRFARQLVFDPSTSAVVAEYVVPLEGRGGRSRIAGAAWADEPGVFTLLEYLLPVGAAEGSDSRPSLFRIDTNLATNLLELSDPEAASAVLESQADEPTILAKGVAPVLKTAHAALSRFGNAGLTLPSGLANAGDGRWLVLQDNRYGLLGPLIDPANADLSEIQSQAPGSRLALVETVSVGLDASDKDGGANFASWPVEGLFMPDAIGVFEVEGQRYLVTANEGDSREYGGSPGYIDETRLEDSAKPLDSSVFPDANSLLAEEALGRLKISTVDGDDDNDGLLETITAFGGRSFSIWRTSDGALIYDSADELARSIFELEPEWHNANGDSAEVDTRSDDMGVEPEGLAIGEVAGRPYLFLGLERTNHVMVYDLSSPRAPAQVAALRFDGDVSPEGLTFVPAADSATGRPFLVISYEVSGTVAIVELNL